MPFNGRWMDRNEFEFLFPGRRECQQDRSPKRKNLCRTYYVFARYEASRIGTCSNSMPPWICIKDRADIWIQFGGMLATFPCKLWSRNALSVFDRKEVVVGGIVGRKKVSPLLRQRAVSLSLIINAKRADRKEGRRKERGKGKPNFVVPRSDFFEVGEWPALLRKCT